MGRGRGGAAYRGAALIRENMVSHKSQHFSMLEVIMRAWLTIFSAIITCIQFVFLCENVPCMIWRSTQDGYKLAEGEPIKIVLV